MDALIVLYEKQKHENRNVVTEITHSFLTEVQREKYALNMK